MRSIRLAALALLAAALFSPQDAVTCGPFFPEYVYAPLRRPVDGPAFARGELGVVRPRFDEEALLIAYRHFAGVPLRPEAVASLYPAATRKAAPADRPVQRWLTERLAIPGAPQIPFISQDRPVPGKDRFQSFPNCLDDAFAAAVATLQDRMRRWGNGPRIAEWLRAQDMVFQNCPGGAAIPPPIPGDADRQYQIAAAEFYATEFEEAARDFDAIAQNPDSPWRDSGAYLAARCLIREGTLLNAPDKLREAQTRLAALQSNARWRASARGLEDFVAGRLDRAGLLVKLGTEWMRPDLGANAGQVLQDYTYLRTREGSDPTAGRDEVGEWLAAFETSQLRDQAVERWRAAPVAPWLVAALVWADAKGPTAAELIAAARQLAPNSPAYATATYYGIRLQIERDELDAAREWAEAALATKPGDAVVNLLRAERLRVARTWEEFLQFAVRKPVAETIDNYQRPVPGARPVIDLDFTAPLNLATPLAYWTRAASAPALPRDLEADVAQAGWARAVLLDDTVTARALAARALALRPVLAAPMRDWLAHPDRFTAALWMLRLPGLTPTVRDGVGRTTVVGKIDNYRDNWWRVGNTSQKMPEALQDLYGAGPVGQADFLPPADRAAGQKEWERIVESASNGVNYLCATVIDYAKSQPQDPRVPEALALSVRATRYGQTDKASSAYSKQAFEILHRRYPDSDWAKKTKYYY
jgi:hypothetical protein